VSIARRPARTKAATKTKTTSGKYVYQFGKKTDDRADGKWPGPVHNSIKKPDRKWDGSKTDDNSTSWAPKYEVPYYTDLMFGDGESFRDFYLHQSQGQFLAKGAVSDWVKVPYNEARYGSNHIMQSDGYWNFIKDSATSWYAAQIDKGMSQAEIRKYLSDLSSAIDMIALMEPVTHQSPLYGWAGWIHWETSGAHFYAWERPLLFFSVDIYTCKAFDVRDAVEFTREHLRADPVEHKSF